MTAACRNIIDCRSCTEYIVFMLYTYMVLICADAKAEEIDHIS
jgi:hypothetical protein